MIKCSDQKLKAARKAIFTIEDRDSLANELKGLFPEITDENELIIGIAELISGDKKILDPLFAKFPDILNAEERLVKTDKIKKVNYHKTNKVDGLYAGNVFDLFHSLTTARPYFEQESKRLLKSYIFENNDSDTYINSNEFVNKRIKVLKNDLFKTIVNYLIEERVLARGTFYDSKNNFIYNLYDAQRGTFNERNFKEYNDVMDLLYNNLLSKEKYIIFNKKKIPNISGEISKSNRKKYDVYNAAVMLANFDSVVTLNFNGILDVNPTVFGTFEDPLKGNKYVFRTKGKTEQYWLDDNHLSEGAENLSDSLSDLFITSIRRKDKQNQDKGEFLTRNDFYALASLIDAFERKNIKMFSAEGDFTLLSRNPRKMLKNYIFKIRQVLKDNIDKKPIPTEDLKYLNSFENNADVVFSLYDYITQIEEKENLIDSGKVNQSFSVYALLGHVLNNTFGATYAIYGARRQVLGYKELYSHDAASIATQERVYSRLWANRLKPHLYLQESINNLETNEEFSNYIFSRYGLSLPEEAIDTLKERVALFKELNISKSSKKALEKRKTELLKEHLSAYLSILLKNRNENSNDERDKITLFDKIAENEINIVRRKNDEVETKTEVISDLNALMQPLIKTYLLSQKSIPLTTIETASGEKIPTFKLANLAYNDSEILLRQYEREKRNPLLYKNLFVNALQPMLLGTTTKLELIAGDVNKSASSWSPMENFTSSFNLDFLGLATNPKLTWFNLVIGNYSDKNTILAKQISKDSYYEGKRIIGGENSLTQEELTNLVVKQQRSFLIDTYKEIITKFNKLFDINENVEPFSMKGEEITKTYFKSTFNRINEELQNYTQDKLLTAAEKAGVSLVEEKDYALYKDPKTGKVTLRLNQNLFDYIHIYSTKDTFNTFIDADLKEVTFNLMNQRKTDATYLLNGDDVEKLGEDGLAGVMRFFGITEKEMRPFLTLETKNVGLEGEDIVTTQYPALLFKDDKGNTNPLLKRWYLVNLLLRNEYLNITVKHEYMHSAKKLKPREIEDIGNYESFMSEASPRYSGMAKRNVAFTSTFERAVQNFKFGVPPKVNIAVINDPSTGGYNIDGDKENIKYQDGSSTVNYIYSKMIDASYPGKGYNGTLKRFGVFITDNGSAVKKDAEQVLTNKLIRRSDQNGELGINYLQKQKQMLSSHPIEIESLSLVTNGLFILENGKYYKVNQITITNNNLVRDVVQIDLEGNEMPETRKLEEPIKINTLFDVWNSLGGQYSGEFDGNKFRYNEQSNEMLYKVVVDQQDLKEKMIHIISNFSAFKSGAVNLNPSTKWYNDAPLRFESFESYNIGPQLDAGHSADASKIKEISQVLSSLSQSDTTTHIAHEAYQDIAKLIKESAQEYTETLNKITPTTVNSMLLAMSKKLIDHIANSKGATLASSLVTVFENNAALPFSNQNFFEAFIQNLIVRLNSDFISRYYNGIGAILVPSHNAVKVYELDGVVYTQEDIITKAINDFNSNPPIIGEEIISPEFFSNKAIIERYIKNTFIDQITTLDNVQFGDLVIIDEKQYDVNNPSIYYYIKNGLGLNHNHIVKIVKRVPRDLRPQQLSYKVMTIPEKSYKDALHKDLSLADLPESITSKINYVTPTELKKLTKKSGLIEGAVTSKGIFINNSLETGLKNAITLHEVIGHYGLKGLFEGEAKATYANILLSSKEYLYANKELLKRGNFASVEDLALTYQIDLNTEEGQLDILEELLARQAEQDNLNLSWFDKAIGRLQILIAQMFGLTKPMGREGVIELLLMARRNLQTGLSLSQQLAQSNEVTFPQVRTKTMFDLDSVRLKYALKQLSEDPTKVSQEDLETLHAFATKFGLYTKKEEFDIPKMEKYLRQWTQRELAFLDKGIAIRELSNFRENGKLNLDRYFGADPLVGVVFDDVKDEYSTQKIFDYYFKGAELILSNIYKTTFDTSDDIYHIKEKGYKYFEEKLAELHKEDEENKDMKIVLPSGQEIYIKLVYDVPPFNEENPSMFVEDNGKKFRVDNLGHKLYRIPNNTKVFLENNKDVVYIAVSKYSNGVNEGVNVTKPINVILNSIREIKGVVPLLNNTINNIIDKYTKKPIDVEKELMTLFLEFSKINMSISGNPKTWYQLNKQEILTKLAKKQHVSWDKSREFVAARIPAQSMQSFMPMENVAYFDDDSNNAYVSVWQIWLQGSDFDIDKAYIMGHGFNKNSQLDLWTNLFDYSTKEELRALELLPIATNSVITNNAELAIDLDLTSSEAWFQSVIDKAGAYNNHFELAKAMDVDDIKRFADILKAVKKVTENETKRATLANEKTRQINVAANELLVDLINYYNAYTEHIDSQYALQNSIVSKILRTISAPSNQLLATKPVSIQQWHDGADAAKVYRLINIRKSVVEWVNLTEKPSSLKELIASLASVNKESVDNDYLDLTKNKKKKKETLVDDIVLEVKKLIDKVERFSPTSTVGMYKQQHQAIVGKKDVGIGANGLKVVFALSDYYNQWYDQMKNSSQKPGMFNHKSFYKEFYIGDKLIPKTHIADVKVSKERIQDIAELYGIPELEKEYNAYVALSLSGFVSGATDNAKELVMAKINAVVDLAAMHIYMLSLGFSAEDVSVYMNGDLPKYVAKNMETNLFEGSERPNVNKLVDEFIASTEMINIYGDIKLNEMRTTFLAIYSGAREFSSLASIFKVNTSLSANAQELNNFLGVVERAMYSAEINAFGSSNLLLTLKGDMAKVDENRQEEVIQAILSRNSTLKKLNEKFPAEVKEYIFKVLNSSANIEVSYINYDGKEEVKKVNIRGGDFDARYYLHPKNVVYRNAAAEYYNLIKNTINIFDVLEEVPHFREMTHAVGMTFQIALLASKKFNWVFSEMRDIAREEKRRLTFSGGDNNSAIKHIYGNDAFRLDLDEYFVKRAMRTFDTYMIGSWLRDTNDPKVVNMKLRVQDLLKAAGEEEIVLYSDNGAKVYSKEDARQRSKYEVAETTEKITIHDAEDKIIDLTTDFGIANYKIIVEQLMLPILQKSKSTEFGKLLTLRSIKNGLGTFSQQITPVHGLSSLNNAVSIENFAKTINEFNKLDMDMDIQITNPSSKVLKWKDLLYVYNLIANNEAYGDLRLTPLFQDYAKEEDSIARSFLEFTSRVDSPDPKNRVDIFETTVSDHDKDNLTKTQIRNNIIFLTFNRKGGLNIDNNRLQILNGDFLINTSLVSKTFKDGLNYQLVRSIMSTIKSQNLLIKYICK